MGGVPIRRLSNVRQLANFRAKLFSLIFRHFVLSNFQTRCACGARASEPLSRAARTMRAQTACLCRKDGQAAWKTVPLWTGIELAALSAVMCAIVAVGVHPMVKANVWLALALGAAVWGATGAAFAWYPGCFMSTLRVGVRQRCWACVWVGASAGLLLGLWGGRSYREIRHLTAQHIDSSPLVSTGQPYTGDHTRYYFERGAHIARLRGSSTAHGLMPICAAPVLLNDGADTVWFWAVARGPCCLESELLCDAWQDASNGERSGLGAVEIGFADIYPGLGSLIASLASASRGSFDMRPRLIVWTDPRQYLSDLIWNAELALALSITILVLGVAVCLLWPAGGSDDSNAHAENALPKPVVG